MEGTERILQETGLPGQVIGAPPMFDVLFTPGEVHDYRSTLRSDAEMVLLSVTVNARLREWGGRFQLIMRLLNREIGGFVGELSRANRPSSGPTSAGSPAACRRSRRWPDPRRGASTGRSRA
jgi:hypothetical protein